MFKNRKIFFSYFKKDNTAESFRAAFEYLRNNPCTDLIVEPGEYVLTDKMAVEALTSVMNGDWGSNPQPVMFNPDYRYFIGVPIFNLENCSVIAENVKLIVDGFMEPVSVKDCRNVTINGFEITHRRKPFSRGTVTGVSGKICTIEFDSDCPVTPKTPMLLRYFFHRSDSDEKIMTDIESWKYIDSYHIELKAEDDFENISRGMEFYTAHTYHSRPALLIENSRNITVDGMIIRNQPGMGIVGNRSEDIFIRNLKVIPEDGYEFSTNTDATHFTSIKGKLCLENCIAEGQGDDFTNVHSYYQIAVRKTGERSCIIRENTPDGTHSQSIDYPDVGDVMELSEFRTLRSLGEYKVKKVKLLYSEHCCEITLDRPIPEKTDGLVLSDITRLPHLKITGCSCRNHYARGILIKCRSGEIEDNSFYGIMGPAIEIAAEADWYEGVVPSDISVKNNIIENCGIKWGEASGIVVKTDCEEPVYQTIHNITIENNKIYAPDSKCGIYCRNADGLKIKDNIIASSGSIVTENCVNID